LALPTDNYRVVGKLYTSRFDGPLMHWNLTVTRSGPILATSNHCTAWGRRNAAMAL